MRWIRCAVAVATALATFFLVTVAWAAPDPDNKAQPNGPWVTPNQQLKLEGFMDYAELTSSLQRIDARSDLVEVESAGTTAEGRDIWLAKIGDPAKTPVMFMAQQHGDEPHGAEAAVALIRSLSTGSAKARQILDEVYVLILPRVNPDGTEIPERGNADFGAPERDSRSCLDSSGDVIDSRLDQGRGVFTTDLELPDGAELWSYDVNRYHWPDWSESWQIRCNPGLAGTSEHFDPSQNPVPEAVAVLETYAKYQPMWVVDFHNQDIDKVADGEAPENDAYRPNRRITGSVLWPTTEGVAPEAVELSKQLALVMKLRSMELGYMELTRYSGGDFPGIARNAYGLLGSERLAAGEDGPLGGSVLVEISGQTEGTLDTLSGQKARGYLVNNAREMMEAVLSATADGSLFTLDADRVDELLLDNDVDLDNPHRE